MALSQILELPNCPQPEAAQQCCSSKLTALKCCPDIWWLQFERSRMQDALSPQNESRRQNQGFGKLRGDQRRSKHEGCKKDNDVQPSYICPWIVTRVVNESVQFIIGVSS